MPLGRNVLLVSFSGIDGAGKRTQVERLCTHLRDLGLSVSLFVFWEDVAVLSALRERVSHAVFKGELGIGTPSRPVRRRDKDVQSWYAAALRLVLYGLDAVHLRFVVNKARRKGEHVVIFDRYIYDELANLCGDGWFMRAYIRILLALVPAPDLAFLVDAEPALALERKPEYPLDFLERNRRSYLAMSRRVQEMIVLGPHSAAEVSRAVLRTVDASIACDSLAALS